AEVYSIRQSNNGIIDKTFKRIELKTNEINHIPRRRLCDKKYGHNCVQFFTYTNLADYMIDQKKYVQFQISARHGLTCLSNIFTHEYVDKSVIVKGSFKSGNCADVNNFL